jgi:hypothetical protein
MDKAFRVTQIAAFIVIFSTFGGMLAFTDVYSEVHSDIVSVTCLSCIKLQPKTVIEFKFETYDEQPHPDFVLENLTEGPVLLAYGSDPCEFCEVMDIVLHDIFDVYYTVDDPLIIKEMDFDGTTVTFIHVNKHHFSEDDVLRKTQTVYMNEVFKDSVPMFTLITINYNRGIIEPYYATAYGVLQKDTFKERKEAMLGIVNDGIRLYNEFEAGHH